MQWAANQNPTGELRNQTPANVVCFFSAWTAWIISYRTPSSHRCWIGHLSGRWFVAKAYDFPVWNSSFMWPLQFLGLIIKWKLVQPCFRWGTRYSVFLLLGFSSLDGQFAAGGGRWAEQGDAITPRQNCLSWKPGLTLLLSCFPGGWPASISLLLWDLTHSSQYWEMECVEEYMRQYHKKSTVPTKPSTTLLSAADSHTHAPLCSECAH